MVWMSRFGALIRIIPAPFNKSSRDATYYGKRLDIMGNHCPRRNYCALTDTHSTQDSDVGAKPDSALNDYFTTGVPCSRMGLSKEVVTWSLARITTFGVTSTSLPNTIRPPLQALT